MAKAKEPKFKIVRLEPDVGVAVKVAAFDSGRGIQGETNYQLRQVYGLSPAIFKPTPRPSDMRNPKP